MELMKIADVMKQFENLTKYELDDVKNMLEGLNSTSVVEIMTFWEGMKNKNFEGLKVKIKKVSDREYRDWMVKIWIENNEHTYNMLMETVNKVISGKWDMRKAAKILKSNIGDKVDGCYVTLHCLTELIQENVDETLEYRKDKKEEM